MRDHHPPSARTRAPKEITDAPLREAKDRSPPTPIPRFRRVMVGGGGSGLSAAISAAENGATVAMLEKAPYLREHRPLDRHHCRLPHPGAARSGCRRLARGARRDYLKIAGKYADREDRELVGLLTENVTETYSWLRGLGMEFFGPVPDPGHATRGCTTSCRPRSPTSTTGQAGQGGRRERVPRPGWRGPDHRIGPRRRRRRARRGRPQAQLPGPATPSCCPPATSPTAKISSVSSSATRSPTTSPSTPMPAATRSGWPAPWAGRS